MAIRTGKILLESALVLICILFTRMARADESLSPEKCPRHPCLILSAEDVERIKKNIDGLGWAKNYFEGIKAQIDPLLGKGIEIPDKGGGWEQEYVSQESGRELVYNRAEPHRHLDPGTGKYLEGEKYDAAWRDITHYNNAYMALEAGLVYQITGDVKYADFAKSILIEYAEKYHNYKPHGGPAGFGRVEAQSLDEARWLIFLCGAYDLVADSPAMTEDNRKDVVKKLLLPAARHIEGYPYGIHNIQVWESVSMLMAGLLSGTGGLVEEADATLLDEIKKGIRKEGMWYETSVGYHFFASKPFETLAVICRRQPRGLCGEPELKRLFTAMPGLVMPDGNMPAINDGMRIYKLTDSLMGLVAARYAFGDSSLDGIIQTIGDSIGWGKVDISVFMYYVQPDSPPEKWTYPASSIHMPDAGITVLRRNGQYALLKYNRFSGGHDHSDKPGLIYYTQGRELYPDIGTISYGHPLYRSWYRKTEAHNTIMVDGKQQGLAECTAINFAENENFSSVSVKCSGIAEGVDVYRTIVLAGGIMFDVTQTVSQATHTYDLFLHVNAPWTKDVAPLQVETPNKEIKYTQVRKPGLFLASFLGFQTEGDVKPALVLFGLGDIYEGFSTGFFPGEKMPLLMWRQKDRVTTFVSLTYDKRRNYSWSGGEMSYGRVVIRLGKREIKINPISGDVAVTKVK